MFHFNANVLGVVCTCSCLLHQQLTGTAFTACAVVHQQYAPLNCRPLPSHTHVQVKRHIRACILVDGEAGTGVLDCTHNARTTEHSKNYMIIVTIKLGYDHWQ